jgi:hypothetical protein
MKAIPVIIVSSVLVLLLACGKDKFETKPLLEIKDYNSRDIVQGQTLEVRINYFDKEGDLGQAPFVAIRMRQNIFPLPPAQEKADTLRSTLPEFPDKDNGEITFRLAYDFLKESVTENDTLIFRFAVTDRAGNKSDTVNSEPIVVHLP